MTTYPKHLDVLGDLRRRVPAEFTDADVSDLGQAFFAQLTSIVGERMCAGLTDQQIEQFDQLDGDDAAQLAFIEKYCPTYPRIVAESYQELLGDVAKKFGGR